jgi:hypothetical protein
MKPVFVALFLISCITAYGQAGHYMGIVNHYNGIPVFYHCRPLHPYNTLGYMTRTAVVNNITQALEKYAHAAKKEAKGNIGIIIEDISFGTDSFDVIEFSKTDGNIDTAVFTSPVFLSATPIGYFEIVATISGKANWGSLNSNLQRYYIKAQKLNVPFDGIIVNNVDYAFEKDEIMVFRWKK